MLVVGAGGLARPCCCTQAAGIGTLGIVDDDAVSLSNLQRQVIHRTEDVGRAKVDRAREAALALDPNINVEVHSFRLNAKNAAMLVEHYDVIADGSDNFDTRYLLAEVCEAARKAAGACRGE